MAKVISYPKETAMAFNTISKKRAAIPLFPMRNINLQEKIKPFKHGGWVSMGETGTYKNCNFHNRNSSNSA